MPRREHSTSNYQAPEKWSGGGGSCCRPLKGSDRPAGELAGVAVLLRALRLLENLCLPGHSPPQPPLPRFMSAIPGSLELWQKGSREESQIADFSLWCTEGQDFHRGTWPKALLPHRACPLEGKERKGRSSFYKHPLP